MLVLRLGLDIGYVDHREIEDRPPDPVVAGWARREEAVQVIERFWGVVVVSDRMDQLAIELKVRAEEAVSLPHRVPDDGVEHRLHVGLRPADHA